MDPVGTTEPVVVTAPQGVPVQVVESKPLPVENEPHTTVITMEEPDRSAPDTSESDKPKRLDVSGALKGEHTDLPGFRKQQ